MLEQNQKVIPNPKETGVVLFYLVGSKTDELMNDKQIVETIGITEDDRDEVYIEITIMNMFIMIKQYTSWEKDESKFTKALDQMHFLLFHQLKELSNYDEDDIEQLHRLIFERYDEYGDYIEQNYENNWTLSLAEAVMDNINSNLEEKEKSITQISRHIKQFDKAIPNILHSL